MDIAKNSFFEMKQRMLRTIRGLRSFLTNLEAANLALGIASSGSRGRVDFLLDQLKLKKHFGVVVTGDEVSEVSHTRPFFLKLLKV